MRKWILIFIVAGLLIDLCVSLKLGYVFMSAQEWVRNSQVLGKSSKTDATVRALQSAADQKRD